MGPDTLLKLLTSALTIENPYHDVEGILKWLNERKAATAVKVSKIPFSELSGWSYSEDQTSLVHDSGKFFSIEGIRVTTNKPPIFQWEQPIINQPEIGYLGFITKEINGVLYFLAQAKVEPGNVNQVQISPTLQATKSNYTRIHEGSSPKYLAYFKNATSDQILIDQLQSEQGARFLKKRNRNIIIKIEEEIEVYEDFIWVTLGQLKRLMSHDNVVNMDTRTVISSITFGNYPEHVAYHSMLVKSAAESDLAIYNLNQIIKWITEIKCKYELEVQKIPLKNVREWIFGKDSIHHVDQKYFSIIAARIEIGNREVKHWTQPMIEPAQEGLIAFVIKKINGVYHFLVQAKLECGNFDIVEIAPTVQCLTGNYKETQKGTLPYLEYVLSVQAHQILYDTYQSEEGGRFYKEQNRNLVVEAKEEFPIETPENYTWMTLNQLLTFLKFNNYLNIQTRSLISMLEFI